MRARWFSGSLDEGILGQLDQIPSEMCAKSFEREAAKSLRELGYMVTTQVRVSDRGDGKRGYVDLIAAKPFSLIAVELDNVSPRKKSIFKVQQVKGATAMLVYCRKHMRDEQ